MFIGGLWTPNQANPVTSAEKRRVSRQRVRKTTFGREFGRCRTFTPNAEKNPAEAGLKGRTTRSRAASRVLTSLGEGDAIRQIGGLHVLNRERADTDLRGR
jgi:hypothetical protein